jgi:gas vesicle protein
VDNKGRTILLGVVLGAGIGLVTALMLSRRAENEGRTTAITAGEGLQLGALVVGLLRTIATLGDTEKE